MIALNKLTHTNTHTHIYTYIHTHTHTLESDFTESEAMNSQCRPFEHDVASVNVKISPDT